MSKLIRLSPTGIEYADYAWNFASGCGNNIGGKCRGGGFNCWAYSITQRFEGHYPNGFKPTIYPDALCSPVYLKKPSRILCAFMGDLFWDCPEFNPTKKIEAVMPSRKASVSMSLKGWIYTTIKQCPQHQFLFLTKQPQNLPQWSPFPDNCWVGVTVTKPEFLLPAFDALDSIQCQLRYLSIEPMLGRFDIPDLDILLGGTLNWVIIGAQTKPYKPPEIEWVEEIVQACDKAGIPVFLKDNLKPLFRGMNTEQQAEYQDILIDHFYARGIEFEHFYTPEDNKVVEIALRQEVPDA